MLDFEEKVLERLQLGVRHAITRHALHGVRVEQVESLIDHMTDHIVYQIRAHVWADPDRHYNKVHRFAYDKAHPTWKHHLVASLPEGSFRRRWCHFFWDIPFDYANTRVTFEVEVDVRAIFPESTIEYPEHLGRVHYPVQITPRRLTEEPYYG